MRLKGYNFNNGMHYLQLTDGVLYLIWILATVRDPDGTAMMVHLWIVKFTPKSLFIERCEHLLIAHFTNPVFDDMINTTIIYANDDWVKRPDNKTSERSVCELWCSSVIKPSKYRPKSFDKRFFVVILKYDIRLRIIYGHRCTTTRKLRTSDLSRSISTWSLSLSR